MDIWSYISKPKYFIPIYPMTISDAFVTTLSITSFLMIPYIDVVLIQSFDDVLLMTRMNKSWMTATLEKVEFILLGWLQLRKSFMLGNFWLSIFKDCHEAVKKYPPWQLFYPKKRTHPALLHPVIFVGPFYKWGVDFMHCNPTSSRCMVTSS